MITANHPKWSPIISIQEMPTLRCLLVPIDAETTCQIRAPLDCLLTRLPVLNHLFRFIERFVTACSYRTRQRSRSNAEIGGFCRAHFPYSHTPHRPDPSSCTRIAFDWLQVVYRSANTSICTSQYGLEVSRQLSSYLYAVL